MSLENANGDWNILREAFDWLSETQLRAAMAFAEANPDFIRERIDRDGIWTLRRFGRTTRKRDRGILDEVLS